MNRFTPETTVKIDVATLEIHFSAKAQGPHGFNSSPWTARTAFPAKDGLKLAEAHYAGREFTLLFGKSYKGTAIITDVVTYHHHGYYDSVDVVWQGTGMLVAL